MEARQGCPFKGVGSTGRLVGNKQTRIAPVLLVWGTCRKNKLLICYTCAESLGQAVLTQVSDSFSGRFQESRLDDTLLVFLWGPCPLPVPQSFSQLFQKTSWALSNVWVWVSACEMKYLQSTPLTKKPQIKYSFVHWQSSAKLTCLTWNS